MRQDNMSEKHEKQEATILPIQRVKNMGQYNMSEKTWKAWGNNLTIQDCCLNQVKILGIAIETWEAWGNNLAHPSARNCVSISNCCHCDLKKKNRWTSLSQLTEQTKCNFHQKLQLGQEIYLKGPCLSPKVWNYFSAFSRNKRIQSLEGHLRLLFLDKINIFKRLPIFHFR